LISRYVFFGIDRIDWALGYTNRTIDAFIRINGEKIWAFAKAVYRANINTIRITAADARFGHNVSHKSPVL
jgi:hypothetical protein